MTDTTAVKKSKVSIVVPVYSGEHYLEKLIRRVGLLRNAWEAEDAPLIVSDMVLVDDASIDGSAAIIDKLAKELHWIVPLHLARNFGQHGATVAGILHSSGDWIVTIDEDLQHRPECIPELLARAVANGADVVYARPESRAIHGRGWRDWSSRGFKKLMVWLTGEPTLSLVNSFRVIRGPIGRATASVSSHSTYFDVALSWYTRRIETVEMEMRDERFTLEKKSGYDFGRLFTHAQRMLFSSQIRFLSAGLWIGGALFIVSLFLAIYIVLLRILAPDLIGVQGWASIILGICMSSGLLSLMVGTCLQYLSTLVQKAHGRPTFFTVDRSSDARLAAWFGKRKAEREGN